MHPQIPAVLFYERVDSKDMLDFSQLPLRSDPAILCEDITISKCVCRPFPVRALLSTRPADARGAPTGSATAR